MPSGLITPPPRRRPPPLSDYAPPQQPWLSILYEDEAVLVLNKPAGLLSVPGKSQPDCLEARAQDRYSDAHTVHRLDMATSGICVMARGKANLANLQQQFEKRQTEKRYVAIVAGCPEPAEGTIDAPIRCDWPNRPLQMICREDGRQAITHYATADNAADRARMILTPITGRSHQLRLHMASIGHPILGDEWYAPEEIAQAAPRLLLHAERLSFRHPQSSEMMVFVSTAPF